jgi:hypothetical protein
MSFAFFGREIQPDLYLIPFDPYRIHGNLQFGSGVVEPGSFFDAEPPGMPGTGNGALFVHVACRERGSLMRAEVIDGSVISLIQEYGNHQSFHMECTAFPFRNVSDFGNRMICEHRNAFVD